MFAGEIDSALASQAEGRATASEREAQLLIGTSDSGSDAEPHVPAGGPPTREEVYEAEMHPWPHHGMAETIKHNRELRKDPGDSGPQSGPSDAQAEP